MRRIASYIALAVTFAFIVACGDTKQVTAPATRKFPELSAQRIVAGCPLGEDDIERLIGTVFGRDIKNGLKAWLMFQAIELDLFFHNTPEATKDTYALVDFIIKQYKAGGMAGTNAQGVQLVNGIFCYAGVTASVTDLFNSNVVNPNANTTTTVTNSTGTVGTQLPPGSITTTVVITFNPLPNDPSVLNTKLDKYPGFVQLTQNGVLAAPVVVGVCPTINIDPVVFARLRLGHQKTSGFEVTPPADASFLNCPVFSAQSKVPKWLQSLATLVMPKPLYAAMRRRAGGGVGGLATEFSPFGAVDPELSFSGGVGGTATEFKKSGETGTLQAPSGGARTAPAPSMSKNPGTRSYTVVGGVCTVVAAEFGTPLEQECRPGVTLKTHLGTILTGVPVTWDGLTGGGTIAPEASVTRACGTAGTTAATTTDANGKAGICWTMGPTPSIPNTVTATPSAGGDAPVGVTFSPPSKVFTATSLKKVPVATVNAGGPYIFDALPHAATGTCTYGLTPAITYVTGGAAAPVNAGSYTATTTCGDGDIQYTTVTASAPLTINPATPTVTISCPVSVVFNNADQTPCGATATGVGAVVLGTPPVVYAVGTPHNAGPYTANASFGPIQNYTNAAAPQKTFTITPAPTVTTLTCPANVPYNGVDQSPCTAKVNSVGLVDQPVTPVAYTPSPAHNAGNYGASATYVATQNYQTSSAIGSTTITKLPATALAGSGSMFLGGTVPPLPCTIGGLLGLDAGAVTCGTSIPGTLLPGANVTTPIVNPLVPVNYAVTPSNGTLTVKYVQKNCFDDPLYATPPSTSKYSKKGKSVSVQCTMRTFTNHAVVTAKGNLVVQDMGTTGSGSPVQVYAGTNVFSVHDDHDDDADDGVYTYNLSTSPSAFVTGHYYKVTATWDDGTTTVGWFYLKS